MIVKNYYIVTGSQNFPVSIRFFEPSADFNLLVSMDGMKPAYAQVLQLLSDLNGIIVKPFKFIKPEQEGIYKNGIKGLYFRSEL